MPTDDRQPPQPRPNVVEIHELPIHDDRDYVITISIPTEFLQLLSPGEREALDLAEFRWTEDARGRTRFRFRLDVWKSVADRFPGIDRTW